MNAKILSSVLQTCGAKGILASHPGVNLSDSIRLTKGDAWLEFTSDDFGRIDFCYTGIAEIRHFDREGDPTSIYGKVGPIYHDYSILAAFYDSLIDQYGSSEDGPVFPAVDPTLRLI